MTAVSTMLSWFGYDQVNPLPFITVDDSTLGMVRRLDAQLGFQQQRMWRYDRYYEGEQEIQFLAPAMQAEFGDRFTSLVLNWLRLGADAYEARLDVEGFRYSGNDASDESLWGIWQANDLDEQAQQAHLDSIVLGHSYAMVTGGDAAIDGLPRITVESPFQMTHMRDPMTRQVSVALKRWNELDGSRWAILFEPNRTLTLAGWKERHADWQVVNTDVHNLGKVPVVPLVNRPRMLRPDGVSEFHDVIPIADAANKMATDMMVSGEYHAMPRRWAAGMKESDFVDQNGSSIPTFSLTAGRLWATENEKATFGQFPEAQLSNFHQTIKLLGELASQMLALPPHYLSFVADNPASADAIRSSEVQMVKRVERKQVYLGGAWEDVMRLALRQQTGSWDPAARSLETQWRSASTPTVAEMADAVMKKVAAKIIPIEQAREDLGYSPEQRRRMAEMDRMAAAGTLLALQDASLPPTPPVDAAVQAAQNSLAAAVVPPMAVSVVPPATI